MRSTTAFLSMRTNLACIVLLQLPVRMEYELNRSILEHGHGFGLHRIVAVARVYGIALENNYV